MHYYAWKLFRLNPDYSQSKYAFIFKSKNICDEIWLHKLFLSALRKSQMLLYMPYLGGSNFGTLNK